MFLHYHTQGFILKKENFGEADQFLTIYTKDWGKLEVLAKGIRKVFSKLNSGVENFSLTEVEFIRGKNYKTLTDAVIIKKFANLKRGLEKLQVAFKISKILDNLVKGEGGNENIWQLLGKTFQGLDSGKLKPKKANLIFQYFSWNLFSYLGFLPELYRCLFCRGKLVAENLHFDLEGGGTICPNCLKRARTPKKVSDTTVKILRLLTKSDWETLMKLKTSPQTLKELDILCGHYYNIVRGGAR